MSHKEQFIKALKCEKIFGRVPTFELVFYLTMQKFGKVHPTHRVYSQWNQMTACERDLHTKDIADCYIDTAKEYDHSCIFVHANPGDIESVTRLLEIIREKSNDEYFLGMHGDPTFGIPTGDEMTNFAVRLYEDPQGIVLDQRRTMYSMLEFAEKMKKKNLLDGFILCSDYCFNVNPFYTVEMFDDLIAPILSEVIQGYHDLGLYAIKHTDGNIMPLLKSLLQCNPDALHSLDPQGGVDLRTVKQICQNKCCVIGNVNCGLLQTGTDQEVINDVRRALREGMPGYGYIFSTSNCVYTGMDLERYELMNRIWKEEGIYQ